MNFFELNFFSGVARKLERKSRQNARKMSSLVGKNLEKESDFSIYMCACFFN
jgi:hypothetical protein